MTTALALINLTTHPILYRHFQAPHLLALTDLHGISMYLTYETIGQSSKETTLDSQF